MYVVRCKEYQSLFLLGQMFACRHLFCAELRAELVLSASVLSFKSKEFYISIIRVCVCVYVCVKRKSSSFFT